MNIAGSSKKVWKIGILAFTIMSILAMTFPKMLQPKSKVKKPKYLLASPTMCAPINTFNAEIANANAPMAPKLNVPWTSNFQITTNAEGSQEYFDQGLFYIYAFNHAEAERSFKEAARLDPDCAMCYWGIALSLGPNINRPMPEEQIEDAYDFSRKALEEIDQVTNKEKALLLALSKRYVQDTLEDRSSLDLAYATEMRIVSHRFREDLNIATLFAESLMDLIPWNYWLEDETPKPETREVHAILDYVLEKDPGHPGANHYYIHSVEAIHPDLGVPSADKLKEIEYSAGHLVHMPSHIYVRVGKYHEASTSNQKAIAVDEAYIEQCNAQGFYPALYYPHNLHFLWFASSMEGRSEISIEAARKIVTKVPKEMVSKIPRLQRFYSVPFFALVRFGKWDTILKEPKPDDEFQYLQIIWHYARGMAFAKKGQLKNAAQELKKVEEGMDNEQVQALNYPRFPTIGMSNIAYHILSSEIEGQKNNFDKKVQHIQKAVAIQDGFTYMEPPFFYYPVRQSLGAALLEANKPTDAELVYRKDLEFFPKNGWSLFGLHKSLIQQNKVEEAKEVYQKFKKAWSHSNLKLKQSVM